MSGGQHQDDEANGPSRSGEVKRKEAEIARAIDQRCCVDIRVCSGKAKIRQNVPDGADFVRVDGCAGASGGGWDGRGWREPEPLRCLAGSEL
jgi:hypothetical protein